MLTIDIKCSECQFVAAVDNKEFVSGLSEFQRKHSASMPECKSSEFGCDTEFEDQKLRPRMTEAEAYAIILEGRRKANVTA